MHGLFAFLFSLRMVLTMSNIAGMSMRTTIRKIGNSQGILIPKPMLVEAGMETEVDISVENGTIVLRPIRDHQPRAGWADAACEIAAQGNDVPAWPEFANAEDAALTW
jgi:antitoxin MazE